MPFEQTYTCISCGSQFDEDESLGDNGIVICPHCGTEQDYEEVD